MLSIPSFNVLRRKTENVNSSPYIVFFLRFFIFSQTMFASTSRYVLFKPSFFHGHGQEELSLRRLLSVRL